MLENKNSTMDYINLLKQPEATQIQCITKQYLANSYTVWIKSSSLFPEFDIERYIRMN